MSPPIRGSAVFVAQWSLWVEVRVCPDGGAFSIGGAIPAIIEHHIVDALYYRAALEQATLRVLHEIIAAKLVSKV